MKFKGTKGTFRDGETGWKVKTNDKHWNNPEIQNHEIIWSDDEECVVDHVYKIEDAKLIAAAPDLLEALQYCIDCLGDEFALPQDCIVNAENVIRKALK